MSLSDKTINAHDYFTRLYHDTLKEMTGPEWADRFNIEVLDPDGWRKRNLTSEDKIDFTTFIQCYFESTCKHPSIDFELEVYPV